MTIIITQIYILLSIIFKLRIVLLQFLTFIITIICNYIIIS